MKMKFVYLFLFWLVFSLSTNDASNLTNSVLISDSMLGQTSVGLGNLDNTSDLNKPVSDTIWTALTTKPDLIGGKIPLLQLPTIRTASTNSTTAMQTPTTQTTTRANYVLASAGSTASGSEAYGGDAVAIDTTKTAGNTSTNSIVPNGNAFITSYDNSLAAAVAAIGSAEKTLEITTPVGVSSNLTIPKNIRLKFDGDGYITSAGAAIVTIENGQGLEANQDRRIFRGGVTVRFQQSYPNTFYCEWWGCVGDGVTNDYAAIQAMYDSMQNINTMGFGGGVVGRGGNVKFGGKNYAIRSTIQVNTTTYTELSPSTQIIVLEGNTGAFRFNGLVTEDAPQPFPRSSVFSTLKGNGGKIFGTFGANTHNVTVHSNLTVTRNTGAAFAQTIINDPQNGPSVMNTGFTDGYTVTIDNMHWIIKSRESNNQVTLYPYRLAPQYNSPNSVRFYIPSSLPASWVGATMTIKGQPFVIQSITNTGMPMTVTFTTNHNIDPNEPNAQFGIDAEITALPASNYNQTARNVRFNRAAGVDMRMQMSVEDLYIYGFAGHGLQADSNRCCSPFPATQPNSNNAVISNVHSISNAGFGFYAKGINSNNMEIAYLDTQSNAGSIYDSSFLGNHYTKPHLALDFQGAFIGIAANQGMQVHGSQIEYGYSEGGMPSVLLAGSSSWNGGDASTGFAKYYSGAPNAAFYSGRVSVSNRTDFVEIKKPQTGSSGNYNVGHSAVFGAARGNQLSLNPSFLSFGIDSDSAAQNNNGLSYSLGSYTPYNLLGDAGAIHLTYGVVGGGNMKDATPFFLTTSTSPKGAGNIVFPHGLYISGTDTAVPACDENQRGSLRFVKGGAGVADRTKICGKQANGTYIWKDVLVF